MTPASPVRGISRATARVVAVAARELRSAYATPTGWIVLAISSLVAATAFFAGVFVDGRPATLRTVVLSCGWALLVTSPALSMRAVSEEFRQKTWETLFASPAGILEIVLGKAAALATLVAIALLPAAAMLIPLEWYGSPDFGEAACGLLGLFLAGFACASLGLAVSAATASQTVSFLGTFFLWLGLVAGSRILVGVVPIDLAPAVASIDPLRRLDAFAIGLLDSAAVVYFLGLAAVGLAASVVVLERVRGAASGGLGRRVARTTERIAFVGSMALVAGGATWLASQPGVRIEFDATKTRAYSLAPSTVRLLEALEGPWRVHLFVDSSSADPAILRQIDEVLERFEEANASIDARRIDPVDPASAAAFDAALEELVSLRAGDLADSLAEIDSAVAVFDELRLASASEAAAIRAAAAQLPEEGALRRQLEQLASFLGQIATDGGQFRDRVVGFTRTTASRPLPDVEGARSALAQGFRAWGDQLVAGASLFREIRSRGAAPAPVRSVLTARIDPFESLALRMQASRQALEALPALELDALGRELVAGEAAVVTGGGRLAVVPAWRIFPKRLDVEGADRVSYSWGFRGEEVLSGAIRSIAAGAMPDVVFLHSEQDSLLRPRADHTDLVAVADALRSAGFGIGEWTPGRGDRPRPTAGRPIVWVVLPALRRGQLDLSREERLVVEEANRLVEEGEPVLLTAGRSLLTLLGQQDPWLEVLRPFGLEPDGARVVLELVADEAGEPEARAWQEITAVPDSPLADRLRGRGIILGQPMPVRRADPLPDGVVVRTVVAVDPSPTRWLADDWKGDGDGSREVPDALVLREPAAVAAIATRPVGSRTARAALVASGGWMLTAIADFSDQLGGGRTALRNPGNRELLLSLVAWLAGREDLLDAGLSGREVSRIEGLGGRAVLGWRIGFGGLLVLGPIVAGGIVLRRRRMGA
jgi:ABC-type transport system involved in multi-copper enzyme maturation permease subunit